MTTSEFVAQSDTSGRRRTDAAAVRRGKHLDGFIELVASSLSQAGLHDFRTCFRGQGSTILPGYYRATKDWDLVVTHRDRLVACVELKSQVGSFGNNFNNRVEEALGNATDFWSAYEKSAFNEAAPRPFLGYLLLCGDLPGARRPVEVREPCYKVFPEFVGASYAKRYELLCLKLTRERLYDACCFLMSRPGDAETGVFSEPNAEVGVAAFSASLRAHAIAFAETAG